MPAFPAIRFRQAGATDAEVASLEGQYEAMPNREKAIYLEQLAGVDDDGLRRVIEQLGPPVQDPAAEPDLHSLTRKDLDKLAGEHGIDGAAELPSKQAVIDAINSTLADQKDTVAEPVV